MNTKLTSFAHASISIALGLALIPATAQTPRAQSEKELSRKAPVDGVQACSLITRADVTKATGRDPYVDPEPAGQGGSICNVGIGELKVYSGPKSWEAWESTLKGFKKDKEPQTPISGVGERAYFLSRSRTTSIKVTSRSSSRNPATIRSHYRSTRLRAARRIRCVQRSNH